MLHFSHVWASIPPAHVNMNAMTHLPFFLLSSVVSCASHQLLESCQTSGTFGSFFRDGRDLCLTLVVTVALAQ